VAAPRGFGLRCPACGGLYSRVDETRGDVADPRQPRIVRVRTCRGCGHQLKSIELQAPPSRRIRLPDLDRRLAALQRDRAVG
jgi:transcriptional regulator NrdR family protein